MEERCSDGVRAIAQLLHTIWPVGPGKPIYSVQSIMGATENLLDTEFAAEARFSAGLVGILVTLVYFCLPAFLLVVECSLLPFGKPEHSCSKKSWALSPFASAGMDRRVTPRRSASCKRVRQFIRKARRSNGALLALANRSAAHNAIRFPALFNLLIGWQPFMRKPDLSDVTPCPPVR